MKALLLQLLLPPVVIATPWLLPGLRQQWLKFGAIFLLWVLGWCLTLFVWAGPGVILLMSLGLFSAFTTRIRITN